MRRVTVRSVQAAAAVAVAVVALVLLSVWLRPEPGACDDTPSPGVAAACAAPTADPTLVVAGAVTAGALAAVAVEPAARRIRR